jgi:hypothetical protein
MNRPQIEELGRRLREALAMHDELRGTAPETRELDFAGVYLRRAIAQLDEAAQNESASARAHSSR